MSAIAEAIAGEWNANGNCLLVVGATYPEELARVRALVGEMPLLVPGVGAQGGDVAAVIANGRTADGRGLIVSSSRAIRLRSGKDLGAMPLETFIKRIKTEAESRKDVAE